MNTRNRIQGILAFAPAATAIIGLLAASAHAELIVYEGFRYNDAATDSSQWGSGGQIVFPLHGEPSQADGSGPDADATGLAGVWINDKNADKDNMFLKTGSLAFGDLPTAGNHIGFRSNHDNDIFHRDLTADARSSVGGADELWFSVLVEKLQNNFSAAEGGFVLGNQTVGNPRILGNDGTDGLAGFGFAPTTAGNNWTAYAWDGSSQSVGDAVLGVGVGIGDIHLLVGQVSFDTGAGGADQYTLYDYTLNAGSVVDGTLTPICTTLEVDIDQSSLDMVTLTRQVNLNYDELRIATTLAEVLGGKSFDPADFDQDGDVDLVDLDALTAAADLGAGLPVPLVDAMFDLTGDDFVNGADLDQWLADAATINGFGSPYLKGDANIDGDVDIWAFDGSGDAQVLSSNLGTMTGMVWSDGDFNGDGDVDVWAFDGSGDAQHLSSNLGSTNDATAGTAEAIYNAVTGEVTFDVGEGVGVVGVQAEGMKHGEVDTGSPLGVPGQNAGNVLAYFSAAGLTAGMANVGAVLPTGLTADEIAFAYTPLGGTTTAVAVTVIVPEPSTIAMLLVLGLIGLFFCRSSRRA